MAKETQRVIFIKIDIISLKPVSYTETEKISNITLLSPLLINGKNNIEAYEELIESELSIFGEYIKKIKIRTINNKYFFNNQSPQIIDQSLNLLYLA